MAKKEESWREKAAKAKRRNSEEMTAKKGNEIRNNQSTNVYD